MEQVKVIEFLEKNKDLLFPNKEYTDMDLENALLAAPDSFEYMMNSIPFRKPSTVQFISFFPGSLGVDRFYLGDIGKGILKYFTFGGFGIWWIADMISAKNRCRAYNCRKLMEAINDPSVVAQMQNTDEKIKQAGEYAKVAVQLGKELKPGLEEVRDSFFS